jgi:4-oxalocrotonate tautomerase
VPYVNIRVTREQEPITPQQKAALIKGVTDLLVEVIKRGPKTIVVVIDEVDIDNYGIGGETVKKIRRQGA